MAITLVDAVLDRAAILLQDPTHRRWPLDELIKWHNDGQREIVLRKPNATARNIPHQLAAGTKQTIPADGVQFLTLMRNLPGPAIRLVDREIMDAQTPDWHSDPAATKALHFCFNEQDPRNFYVWPPNKGDGSVELLYSAAPTDAVLGGVISVDDIYLSVLLDYIMYRAYSKDAEYTADPGRAAMHLAAFTNTLGGKANVEAAASPNSSQTTNPAARSR